MSVGGGMDEEEGSVVDEISCNTIHRTEVIVIQSVLGSLSLDAAEDHHAQELWVGNIA